MTVLKQTLAVAVGLVLAGAMVVLGQWQFEVYQSSGQRSAAARAAAPPLDLREVAPPGSAVHEGFGRSVRFEGRYDPALQVLVPTGTEASTFRVLSALRQSDGSLVPVVRGIVSTATAPAPAPPPGTVTEVGVLLPSEDDAPSMPKPPGALDAVRLPVLAQRWPGDIVGGFVTLSAPESEEQGMTPTPLDLPQAQGRLRNFAYACQWWLFAVFAVAMAARIARDLGRADDLAAAENDDALTGNPT